MSACTKNTDTDSGASTTAKIGIRSSRAGRWRALVLILVHVAIVAHILHWRSSGSTLTPVEPSEGIQFSTEGVINAGLIFFGITILSTFILGRWFCGWACHVVALQDFCRWLLGKIGIRPRLVNIGLLRAVPWIAFTYMFLMPIVGRLLEGQGLAATSVHLYTSDFWRTFPSWPVALATFFVCGFVIVYFLGAKGFCNYGCPYGAIYGIADQLAPMRIRVTDACEGCGHCTAVCTSNVKVHQEVRDWKMVVDPACMKCLDCVSVCPKDALYVGFGAPAITAKPRVQRKAAPAGAAPERAAARWTVTALFTFGAYWVLSAFNGEVSAYVNPPDWPLISTLTALSLVVMFVFRGKAVGKAEYSLFEEALLGAAFLGALLAIRGLNGLVPLLFALGISALLSWALVQAVRLVARGDVSLQRFRLKSGGAWRTAGFVFAGTMILVLSGVVFAAREQLELRREGKPAFAKVLFNVGVANAQKGDSEAAINLFRRALAFDPHSLPARENLAGMLCQAGRFAEGVEQFEIALAQNPTDPETHALCAQALLAQNQLERALVHLTEAVRLAPERSEWRRVKADVLDALGRGTEAAAERRRAGETRAPKH